MQSAAVTAGIFAGLTTFLLQWIVYKFMTTRPKHSQAVAHQVGQPKKVKMPAEQTSPPEAQQVNCSKQSPSYECASAIQVPMKVSTDAEAREILKEAIAYDWHAQFLMWEEIWLVEKHTTFMYMVTCSGGSAWYTRFRKWLSARKHIPIYERKPGSRRLLLMLAYQMRSASPTHEDNLRRWFCCLPIYAEMEAWYQLSTSPGYVGRNGSIPMPPQVTIWTFDFVNYPPPSVSGAVWVDEDQSLDVFSTWSDSSTTTAEACSERSRWDAVFPRPESDRGSESELIFVVSTAYSILHDLQVCCSDSAGVISA